MPCRARARGAGSDSGFSLIEVLAALIVIAIVTTAAAAFFISGIAGLDGQRQRQEAVFLADQQLQTVQALPVANLVSGRTQTSVGTLFASAAATRMNIAAQDDTASTSDYDATATASSQPAVPTTQTQTVNNVPYTLSTFIDRCWFAVATGVCGSVAANDGSTTPEYRVSVEAAWTKASCASACSYSTNTLIDPSADPQFNANISAPTGSITTPSTATVYNDSTGDHVVITANNVKNGVRLRISTGGGTISNIVQPSDTEIDFTLAAGDAPGPYIVSVINPDGGHFQTTLNEIPTIVAASGWTASGKNLTLTGGGFSPGATLTVNGSAWTSFTRNSYTSATVSNYVQPTNGASNQLVISNPGGTSASYTITAPRVTAVSPTTLTRGSYVTLSVTGTGFTSGLGLSVTGVGALPVTSTTSTQVTSYFQMPSSYPAGSYPVQFVVTNPDGTSATYATTLTVS